MHRSLVLALGLVCALSLGVLVAAQDAPAPGDAQEGACATPADGTPAAEQATPGMATPDAASPEASPEACPPTGETGTTIQLVDIAFSPNAATIPANTDVTIELPNNGSAVHNFNIDAKNNPSDPGIRSGDVTPGGATTVTANLPPGAWYFYCSIPGHEPAGMHGILTVQ
jgi:plastocyanin